ncbi:hypothetical protein [Phytomonospora endophytica]|uniref:Uncharacterized protein n=1 Tax=Phytomonospora endophytica TaxID=714109 RepID=A0A841G0R5_9ACTN|nr:hypothetical protein [Phytomonospora endophytica]MBB6039247.1 hypothetical protein [Phytomonospora endophytica]
MRRVLLITLGVDVVLVPPAVWITVESGQWTPVIGLLAWHLMLPLVPRLQRAARLNLVERVEVSGDRISGVTGRGAGAVLERSSGELVRMRRVGAGRVLKLVGATGGESGLLLVHDVDVEALRRALRAHGWSFQEGEYGEVHAPEETSVETVDPSVPAGTTLVLREGVAKIGARSPIAWILIAAGVLPVVLGGLFLDLDSPLFQPVLLLPWTVLLLAAWVAVAVMAQGREITVRPGSISYRAGTIAQTVDRGRVRSAQVGPRYLRFTDEQGRQILWLPLKWRREELLDLLRSRDWPTY